MGARVISMVFLALLIHSCSRKSDGVEVASETRTEYSATDAFEIGPDGGVSDEAVREGSEESCDDTGRETPDVADDPPLDTGEGDPGDEGCLPQGDCVLPTSWGPTESIWFSLNVEPEVCPDYTGDGIGDNALSKTLVECDSWKQECGGPCILPLLPCTMPLSPLVVQYDGPSVTQRWQQEGGGLGPVDLSDFGTGVSLLAVRPVTFDPEENKVYVSPSSYGDYGCAGICEPRVYFRRLRCEWCVDWTVEKPSPRYESEVIHSVEVALPIVPCAYCGVLSSSPREECFEECFNAIFGSDAAKRTVVTLRKLVLRIGYYPGMVLGGIVSLEDLKKWWDARCPPACSDSYPYVAEAWKQIEDAADIDLDGDGVKDAVTFCLRLDERRKVELVGWMRSMGTSISKTPLPGHDPRATDSYQGPGSRR